HQRPPELTADRWILLSRIAAAASLLLLGVSIALLSLANPSGRCPAWHLRDSVSTSLWVLVGGWALPLAVISCAVAIAWKKIAYAALKQDERPTKILFGLVTVRTPFPYPITVLVAYMCVVPAVMSNLPLAFIVFDCVDWPLL